MLVKKRKITDDFKCETCLGSPKWPVTIDPIWAPVRYRCPEPTYDLFSWQNWDYMAWVRSGDEAGDEAGDKLSLSGAVNGFVLTTLAADYKDDEAHYRQCERESIHEWRKMDNRMASLLLECQELLSTTQ